jgi:hypothetical protein
MRFWTYLAALAVVAWLSVAPTSASSEMPFSHSSIRSSCAPWDGPAIEIVLTQTPAECKQPSGPYIEIGIWRGLPIQAGQTVKLGPTSDTGFATRCTKAGDCNRAESGTIVFERYHDGARVAGRYELHFQGGETVKGTFDGKYCQNRVLCG